MTRKRRRPERNGNQCFFVITIIRSIIGYSVSRLAGIGVWTSSSLPIPLFAGGDVHGNRQHTFDREEHPAGRTAQIDRFQIASAMVTDVEAVRTVLFKVVMQVRVLGRSAEWAAEANCQTKSQREQRSWRGPPSSGKSAAKSGSPPQMGQ